MDKVVSLLIFENFSNIPWELGKTVRILKPLETGKFEMMDLMISFSGNFRAFLEENGYKLCIMVEETDVDLLEQYGPQIKSYKVGSDGTIDGMIFRLPQKVKRKIKV